MLEIKLVTGRSFESILIIEKNLQIGDVWTHLQQKGFLETHFYISQNGRPISNNGNLVEGQALLIPRLLGGKGGFGSMLRAIGAQIEKTTNREACRDLSGRRLRDINEEKRLKAWIEKQSTRKEEQAEKKKKKLERLCAEPKHEFEDKNYERERSILTERIDDAVEQGFKTAAAAAVANSEEKKIKIAKKGVKRKTLLDEFDEDIDSDELSSSDDDENEKPKKKIAKEESKKCEDSGCSSSIDEHSGSSSDEKKTDKN